MSHARILEMLEESGFDHDEMAEVVDALAPLDELADRAPAPSVELAALLGPASSGASHPTASRSRARGAAVGAVVIALSSVGATGLSAAANTLPRPFQHEVAEFSRDYLPFDLPEPPPPGQPFGAELPQALRRATAARSGHGRSRSRRTPVATPTGPASPRRVPAPAPVRPRRRPSRRSCPRPAPRTRARPRARRVLTSRARRVSQVARRRRPTRAVRTRSRSGHRRTSTRASVLGTARSTSRARARTRTRTRATARARGTARSRAPAQVKATAAARAMAAARARAMTVAARRTCLHPSRSPIHHPRRIRCPSCFPASTSPPTGACRARSELAA